MKKELYEKLKALLDENKNENTTDYLRIIEMLLKIDNEIALNTIYITVKSLLKKSNSF